MKQILKTELTGLTDVLDGVWGKKKSAKDTTKVFDLNKWVNGMGKAGAEQVCGIGETNSLKDVVSLRSVQTWKLVSQFWSLGNMSGWNIISLSSHFVVHMRIT